MTSFQPDGRFYPPWGFSAIPAESAEFAPARVVVLPIPYDSTTTYRAGTRDGPHAIINASQYVDLFDRELEREIYRVGIHTLPEVEPATGGPAEMVDRIQSIAADLLARGKLVVGLGGEHTVTVGLVRAHADHFPDLSVLQIDAHADLCDEFLGTPYNHACVMRRVLERCPAVQVGLRTLSQEEWRHVQEAGLRPFWAEEIAGRTAWVDEVVDRLTEHVYVTIDLDGLDPSIMAAVGTPEPGGLGWYETLALLRAVAQRRRLVGFDLVELAPSEGPPACAFTAARLAYKLMGYATKG